jgi:hypothetical protein
VMPRHITRTFPSPSLKLSSTSFNCLQYTTLTIWFHINKKCAIIINTNKFVSSFLF